MFAVITDVKKLQLALNRAVAALNKSESSPVETYLQLSAIDGQLVITGLDSTSHQLVMTVSADVSSEGSTLIKGDLVKRYNALGSQPVNVQLVEDNRMLRFDQEYDSYTSPTYGGDQALFPARRHLPELKARVDANQLRTFVQKVRAIKEDTDQRVDLLLTDSTLVAYTNSPGLFYRQALPLETGYDDLQVSLPIAVLAKIQDFSGIVALHHEPGLLVFSGDEGSFWVKCQETASPIRGLDALFDKDRAGYWIVNTGVLRTKLAGILAGRSAVPTRLHPKSVDGKMNLQTMHAVEGSSHVVVGLDDATPDMPVIWVNGAGLKTAMESLKTETVMGEYVEHLGRVLLRLTNEDDGLSPKVLVLPVNPDT